MADIISLVAQDLYSENSVKQHALGTLGRNKFGDRFRYVKNGLAALVTGNLLQEPVESTDWDNMAVPATEAIGQTDITVTLGSTATTANLLDDGHFFVSYGTGIGQAFRIVAHEVKAAAAACIFTIDRPLKIALDTTSKITVRKNPYNGVIQYPATTQTGGAVGVALYATTISYFGWIQSGGDCPVLFDTGTNTSNGVTGLGPSAAVAGSVKPASGAEGEIIIGFARDVVSTDSYMGLAHLTID